MTPDLADLTRGLARAEGVPERHLPAVVHRAKRAEMAVARVEGFGVFGAAIRVLACRVVRGAVRDHREGRLEVRA